MPDMLVLFLHRGGDPNVKNQCGHTALHSCSMALHESRKGNRKNCLNYILNWQSPEIDGMVERVSINAVDERGNSACHLAAQCGYHECVDILSKRGAILDLVCACSPALFLDCCFLKDRFVGKFRSPDCL